VKKKKKNKGVPRRWRLNRSRRLEAGKKWLAEYKGKNPVSSYAGHFRCDALCAALELRMLGVSIDENVVADLRRKKPKAPRKPKIYRDSHGEYIRETVFMNGKMKLRRTYVIDGIPADEF
jgi:hypothetical protein